MTASEHHLSDLQLELMRIVWDRTEVTAVDVHAELIERGVPLAPTTVATLLSRLEKRGFLRHRKDGRQYVYRARVAEQDVRRSMLARLTQFFFGGDEGALLSHLVEDRPIASGDLEQIKRLIREREPEPESGPEGEES